MQLSGVTVVDWDQDGDYDLVGATWSWDSFFLSEYTDEQLVEKTIVTDSDMFTMSRRALALIATIPVRRCRNHANFGC